MTKDANSGGGANIIRFLKKEVPELNNPLCNNDSMADQKADQVEAGPSVEDKFGPPHAHQVSDQLHLWILVPGIILLLLAGG